MTTMQFCYPEARPEEIDAFHRRVGTLLGEEMASNDLEATIRLDTLLNAAKAEPVKHWLHDARLALRSMVDAERFIGDNSPKRVGRDVEKATTAAQHTATKLAQVQAAHAEAEAALARVNAVASELARPKRFWGRETKS